jgi:hypothetical protein
VLANILRANQRRISIDEIQGKVSDHYRIRKAEMTSPGRPAKWPGRARSPCTVQAAHSALAARDRPAFRGGRDTPR